MARGSFCIRAFAGGPSFRHHAVRVESVLAGSGTGSIGMEGGSGVVVSCQWSVVSCVPSAMSIATDHGPLTTDKSFGLSFRNFRENAADDVVGRDPFGFGGETAR